MSNTSTGASTQIAEIEIPVSTITTIRFKAVEGRSVLKGEVALPQPLKLERGFSGGEVLVVVEQRDGGFTPIAAAANYLQPEGQSFYYNPKFPLRTTLKQGVVISIPAGATDAPQVFLAGIHDTGESYPLVDIFPVLHLRKPARIELTPITRTPRAVQSSQAPDTPRPAPAAPAGGLAPRAQETVKGTLSFDLNSTGVIRVPRSSSSRDLPSGVDDRGTTQAVTNACNPAGWCNCADMLAFPPNQQIIVDGLGPTGGAYLNWCETIAPYVHIGVVNLNDPRERFTIKHEASVANTWYFQFPLVRIQSWAPNTQLMMNGFHWEGSEGTGLGQYGMPNGYVRDFTYALGDNLIGGYKCNDNAGGAQPCVYFEGAGNKRVMLVSQTGGGFSWLDRSSPSVLSNTTSYVSSSTSIVKDSVCTTDSLSSRWSAVGTTATGRMIFMSSTSDGTTTAAELCSVFMAMGVANAIRLDGGPSAAITVDGVLKNPLTGLYFVKYGSSRFVPYGLKVSYPGW